MESICHDRSIRGCAAALVLGFVGICNGEISAQTFPADNAWMPVTVGKIPIEDANDDCLVSSCEIAGAAPVDQASVLVASDADFIYFRLRLYRFPTANDVDFACEIDSDLNISNSYEYYVGYFAEADTSMQVQTWFNSTKNSQAFEAPVFQDVAETLVAAHDSSSTSLVNATIGDTTNVWRSWVIPWTDLQQPGFEVTDATLLSILCGTRKAGTVNLDVSLTNRADLAGDGTFSDPIHHDGFFYSGFE